MYVSAAIHSYVTGCLWKSEETCRSSSLFPPLWKLQIELRSSGLVAKAFIHCDISLAQTLFSKGPMMIPLCENRTFVA